MLRAMPSARPPRIVVTISVAADQPDTGLAHRKTALYVDSVVRHGATAIPIDAASSAATRGAAFASMDGLMLTGGTDIDPLHYGQPNDGSHGMEPDRDELEAAAFAAASARGVPVLGICRGLQAMNAFSGGSILQHVDEHAGPGWGHGPALKHAMRLVPGTATARILDPAASGVELFVNSYHHQAVRVVDLASGFTAAALSDSPAGPIVEALEGPANGPWRFAVQCHPERTESTPRAFERLFAAFVEACRVR